jgi:hypothetical protein
VENISEIKPTNSRISTAAVRRKCRPTRAEMRRSAEDLGERIHERVYAICESGIEGPDLQREMRAIALDIAGITAFAISIDPAQLQDVDSHRAHILKRIPKVLEAQTYWQRRHWLMELDLDLNHTGFLGWVHYAEAS